MFMCKCVCVCEILIPVVYLTLLAWGHIVVEWGGPGHLIVLGQPTSTHTHTHLHRHTPPYTHSHIHTHKHVQGGGFNIPPRKCLAVKEGDFKCLLRSKERITWVF